MTDIQSFWERVYIAALDQAHQDRTPEVPWSVRAAEIADNAVARWRERFVSEAAPATEGLEDEQPRMR